ncbi:thioredoxin family protein [Celeribacter persicus]|nr:thioredoxin family protein [Celeribacter persicus]
MLTRILASAALSLGLILPTAAMELVMVEQDGCAYCARWNAEIAPIYPKTPEGDYAPLRRVDLRAPRPENLDFKGPVIFTPTFILVDEGVEQGRIEGYAGDEIFWTMLTMLLRDHSDFAPPETQPEVEGSRTGN